MEAKFKTFEKQRIALRILRDNKTNEVLYGGGARGGKSWLGTGWIHMECISKPGSAWLIAREELTKLRDTTLITFFKTAKELGVKDEFNYNAQNFTATFNNGSIVFFRELKYIPSDPEFDRLGSYDLTGAFIDEAQQIHAKAISVLKGRFSVLTGNGWKTIPKVLYTCNPAKNWIYADFVKPSIENNLKENRSFIKSLATDNPFVSQDYIDFLQGADTITKERLLYGNFEYDDDPSSLIPINKIYDCFSNEFVDDGEMYLSADIARFGRDKTVIGIWSGFRLIKIVTIDRNKVTEAADRIKLLCREFLIPISNVIIDDDGVGGGVTDILSGAIGFVNNSRPIENSQSGEIENYNNLKSQCYYKLANQINCSNLYIAENEYRDLIVQELEQVKQYNQDKDGKKQVLPKDKIKELIGRSPDFSDMIMMRMWFALGKRFEFAIK
jgi:phage terminase large subunit